MWRKSEKHCDIKTQHGRTLIPEQATFRPPEALAQPPSISSALHLGLYYISLSEWTLKWIDHVMVSCPPLDFTPGL
ncbi:hypothetical protein KOW79_022231 [Hemibagrus wyckioides]|uniref:Uncharacterized protein n=1 Tax=Hemibagrus wyckioides TaxID=337641 RepID=A0A9D3SCJ0_9TELE|nr:hypothetical protein KOW79_022231 [Hemibagrus wyckioides]